MLKVFRRVFFDYNIFTHQFYKDCTYFLNITLYGITSQHSVFGVDCWQNSQQSTLCTAGSPHTSISWKTTTSYHGQESLCHLGKITSFKS